MTTKFIESSIVFFLLFLLPFLIAPFGITQFENPKVIAAESGIIILFLLSLFTPHKTIHRNSLPIALCLGLLFLTIIDLLFFRTSLSFLGNVFRNQGIFLLWLLILFSFLSSSIQIKKTPWWIFFLLLAIQLVSLFFLPLNESQRYVGTLGEPNALAAFAVFLWPFLFFSIKKFTRVKKFLILSGWAMTLLIIFLSGSRSGLIAFAIQMVFLFFQKVHMTTKTTTLICLCLLLLSLSLPFFEKNTPYENRLEVWQAAIYAGISHPILGGGFGNTELLLHKSAMKQYLRIRFYYVDSSHNIFLDYFVQGGIVGLGLFLNMLFVTIKQLIISEKKREIIVTLGLLTALSFNPASVVGLVGLWWIIGRGFIPSKQSKL